MKRFFAYSAAILISALMVFPSCTESDDSPSPEAVIVAIINGEEIRGDHFLSEYRAVRRRMKIANPKDKNLERELRKIVLLKIIDITLLLEEGRKAGIEITPQARKEMVEGLVKGSSPARLQIVLERNEKSFSNWKEDIHKNMIIEGLIRTKVAPLVKVPEEEIKKYFKKHPNEFKIKERVHAYHIVVTTLSEAHQIRNDIVFGGDFSEVAKRYSMSPDGADGGDLGVFSKGQMPLEFDSVLFELKINQISNVVESPYGFHIFKVTEKFKPRAMKYFEAREIIFNKMFHEGLERKFSEWMKETRKNAKVVVYLERLHRL